jgi:hypothetical protein
VNKYHCDTYKCDFFFYNGVKPDVFCKDIADRFGDDRQPNSLGDGLCLELRNNHNGAVAYVIWVRFKNMYAELAHECLHATMFLFERRGIKIDPNNSEPTCYMVEKLMRVAING